MRIQDFFRGSPRPSQAAALPDLQRALHEADVVCLLGPVGAGKSLMLDAAARYAQAVGLTDAASLLVPTNALLDQAARSLGPEWVRLRRKDAYICRQGGSCADRVSLCPKQGRRRCYYQQAIIDSKRRNSLVVANWHTAMAHKLRPGLVCIDEAHGLTSFLAELGAQTWWRCRENWPRTIDSLERLEEWLRGGRGPRPHLQPLEDVLAGRSKGMTVSWGEGDYRGRPEEFVRLVPLDGRYRDSGAGPIWGAQSKLLLASATISEVDVEAMGFAGRRVAWVHMASEIPVERRPLIWWPVVDGRFEFREPDELARAVSEVLAQYPDVRGIIHATYGVAVELRVRLSGNSRLRWHRGPEDKQRAIKEFLAPINGPDNRVLVVSGQHEGLDLAYDLARFQVLTYVPRGSLADPSQRWLVENDPRRYRWNSIREVAQAYGRDCRAPDDEGHTVLLDSSAGTELESEDCPSWLREAIVRV